MVSPSETPTTRPSRVSAVAGVHAAATARIKIRNVLQTHVSIRCKLPAECLHQITARLCRLKHTHRQQGGQAMADIGEVLELLKDAQEHASEGRTEDVQWLLEAAVSDLEGLLGEHRLPEAGS